MLGFFLKLGYTQFVFFPIHEQPIIQCYIAIAVDNASVSKMGDAFIM
jgi:hypothetical protein